MRLIILITASLLHFTLAAQQTKEIPPIDKSPLDMSYYPANYPVMKIQDNVVEPLVARVIYSRPAKNGRAIFGELVEFGEVWRLGANEATEIEFYKDVKIAGKKVKKGRYSLFCIPNADKWTMIINKETDIWGAFKYDAKKDLLRTTITVNKLQETVENFTMTFEKNGTGFNLVMMWDQVRTELPIGF